MITADQAIATAQQWEDEKAAGPSALVGRALLAHINSLASPQVTDEQIEKALKQLWEDGYHSPTSESDYGDNRDIAVKRALRDLSAPPAAAESDMVLEAAEKMRSMCIEFCKRNQDGQGFDFAHGLEHLDLIDALPAAELQNGYHENHGAKPK